MVSVGTIVWLSSELMFFAALFAMYFMFRSIHPDLWAQETQLLNVPFAAANTTVLVLSQRDLPDGRVRGREGQRRALRRWFSLTFLMGAFFIGGQIFEYVHLVNDGITLSSNAYGSVFYLTTGFHGLHVTGGLIAFLFVMGRHLRQPTVHPPAGDDGDRRVVLLALRRRGVDRTVRHDLPAEVGPDPPGSRPDRTLRPAKAEQ